MSQLHLLLVIDSETMTMHIEGMETAPVDSTMSVFDDPEWRAPTAAEQVTLIDAEVRLHDVLDKAGLTGKKPDRKPRQPKRHRRPEARRPR